MYIGQHELGSWLLLPLLSENGSKVLTTPHITGDYAPTGRVYRGATLIESFRIPQHNHNQMTGMFGHWLHLDSDYAVGQHLAHLTWSVSSRGFFGHVEYTFDVIAGGSTSGSVMALGELQRPNGLFVIGEYDVGTVWHGRNPY